VVVVDSIGYLPSTVKNNYSEWGRNFDSLKEDIAAIDEVLDGN
jgi:hypothetical protein